MEAMSKPAVKNQAIYYDELYIAGTYFTLIYTP